MRQKSWGRSGSPLLSQPVLAGPFGSFGDIGSVLSIGTGLISRGASLRRVTGEKADKARPLTRIKRTELEKMQLFVRAKHRIPLIGLRGTVVNV